MDVIACYKTVILFLLSNYLQILDVKACQQEISTTATARALKLGQLLVY